MDSDGPHSGIARHRQDVLFENDQYLFFFPTTEEEILEQENMFIDGFHDSPRLQFLDVDKEVLRRNCQYAREHDIKHKHRVSVIDKKMNKMCVAYRLERGDNYILISDEVKDDPGLSKIKK